MTRRPRRVRLAVSTLAVGVAAALTVLLAQAPVGATFTAATENDHDSISSSANFCEKTVFLSPAATAWTDESAPAVNQTDPTLRVRSKAGADARTWVRFDLPAARAGCILQAATLRVYDRVPGTPTIVDLLRGDPASPAWTPTTITWENQPGSLGAPIGGSIMTATPDFQVWGITDEVWAQYTSGTNNGFVLQDRYESSDTGIEQQYDGAPTGPTAAHLQLDWR